MATDSVFVGWDADARRDPSPRVTRLFRATLTMSTSSFITTVEALRDHLQRGPEEIREWWGNLAPSIQGLEKHDLDALDDLLSEHGWWVPDGSVMVIHAAQDTFDSAGQYEMGTWREGKPAHVPPLHFFSRTP